MIAGVVNVELTANVSTSIEEASIDSMVADVPTVNSGIIALEETVNVEVETEVEVREEIVALVEVNEELETEVITFNELAETIPEEVKD